MIPYSQLPRSNRKNLRDIIPLKKPFTILFEPTSICNFRCIQCFHSLENIYNHMEKGFMKLSALRKIVDDLKAWKGPKIKVIRIIGFGEPLLNREYLQLLNCIKEADIADRVETTSNASLLTPAISRKMIEYGLDYLRVSIYSALQEKHEAITKNSIRIDKIHDNLMQMKRLKEEANSQKPFVYIKMLDSFDDVENRSFFEYYSDVADEIAIEKPHNWLDMNSKSFLKDLYGAKTEEIIKTVDFDTTMKKVCPQPFKMLSIRFNGDVIVCDPDWYNNTKIGNALTDNIADIWNGDKMFQFRMMQLENRRHENASCRNCTTFLTDNYSMDNIDGFPPEKLRR